MPNCSGINCINRSGNENYLIFHCVPTENNKELQSKRLQNIKRQHLLPSNSFFICFDHSEDCFQRFLMIGNNFAYFV